MLVGQGFVTDCKTEVFTPDNGEPIHYKRVHVMFAGESGGYGEPITMTARADVEFDGMGVYNVTVEPRVRDGKVSWRVAALDSLQLVAPADVAKKAKAASI